MPVLRVLRMLCRQTGLDIAEEEEEGVAERSCVLLYYEVFMRERERRVLASGYFMVGPL